MLKSALFSSPLGPILTISDDNGLYLLEFTEKQKLEKEIEHLESLLKTTITSGATSAINSIKKELSEYFAGSLKQFKTPIHIIGTNFQKMVWQELLKTPYGEIRSYHEQATAIGKPTSYRAVANGNGANKFAIIIPCHRIINKNGKLGGYSAGLSRKKWLIEHEARNQRH